MPVYSAAFQVEVATAQKAVALRDKVAAYIREDPEVTLIAWSAAREQRSYTVYGVDVSTRQPFQQTVTANDETSAAAAVTTVDKIVATVQET